MYIPLMITLIVVGSLNTDIVATNLGSFPSSGEHVYGQELLIGPGGKSRNIADMAAHLMGEGKVAMLGRTVQDKYGLWKVPLDALRESGVNIDFVAVGEPSGQLPGVALIAVDARGNNQIIVLPGASTDFSRDDVDRAEELFEKVARSEGYVCATLECPFDTVCHAVEKAKALGLKVVLDPGGIERGMQIDSLLEGLFLIKPNEHEAEILTGIRVRDFDSARGAAQRLQRGGVENILITVGERGAYSIYGAYRKTYSRAGDGEFRCER